MKANRPIEDRISRWLEEEAPGDLPHFVLEATFERTRSMPQERPSLAPPGLARLLPRRRATWLLVAAMMAALAGGLLLLGGGARTPSPTIRPPANLLSVVQQAGRIRIAVRPDHPQAPIGGVATGFDTDIANEVARRLGVKADIVIVDVPTMLGPNRHTWDVALPSTPDWLVNTQTLQGSSPYYFWPHRLVVPTGSAARGIQDLAAGPICAVAGDPSESWLRGGYGGTNSSPVTLTVITRGSDAECLSALADGSAHGAVTAHLSDAELRVNGDTREIGGPDAEPRSVLVRLQAGSEPDPADLLAAVDDAIAAMRADGTLTRLSQSRFGGDDLTTR